MPASAEPALPKPTPFWRKALSSPLLVAGAVLVGLLILLAAAAP